MQSSGILGAETAGNGDIGNSGAKNAIPQSVLDAANKAGVLIRDVNGKVY